MKYYKVMVAYLVSADDEPVAKQKVVSNQAILTKVVSVDDVTTAVEQAVQTMRYPQPEKGLY